MLPSLNEMEILIHLKQETNWILISFKLLTW